MKNIKFKVIMTIALAIIIGFTMLGCTNECERCNGTGFIKSGHSVIYNSFPCSSCGMGSNAPLDGLLPIRGGRILSIPKTIALTVVILVIAGIIGSIAAKKEDTEKKIKEKKFPFCAEIIKKEAIICKHCGKSVNENL